MKYTQRLFDEIESILPFLSELSTTGAVDFKTMENRLLIGRLMKEINPSLQINHSCNSCMNNYLRSLEALYQRGYPKYIKSQEQEKIEVLPVETVVEVIAEPIKDEVKKVDKPKRVKKNAK